MHATTYLFGNFSLNARSRELRFEGTLIATPMSAFDRLLYLVEQRVRPVCRAELMSAAWGRADN